MGLLAFGIDRIFVDPIIEGKNLPVRYSQGDQNHRLDQWLEQLGRSDNNITSFFSEIAFYIVRFIQPSFTYARNLTEIRSLTQLPQ